jgi:hypothetical protein
MTSKLHPLAAFGVQLGGRYYAEGPGGAPDWGVRLNFTLLFPTARPQSEPGHKSFKAASTRQQFAR